MNHAYSHLIGTQIGVLIGTRTDGTKLIVRATIGMPGDNQDHSYVRAILSNGMECYVRMADTYRADFWTGEVNNTLAGYEIYAM